MNVKTAGLGLARVDFDDAEEKRRYNRGLFDVVAPAYQRVTAVLSFGRDQGWKRRLVSWLPAHPRPVCVDLATGTGDFLPLLRERYPDGEIVGVDLSRRMMGVARAADDGRERESYVCADMMSLPLPDESVDIITAGYALRNAPDLEGAIAEIVRVLRPGGRAAVLDFSRPGSRAASAVELFILETWGRIWGRWFHRNGDVYGYIARSLSHFPDRDALTGMLGAAGLDTEKVARPLSGILELRLVRK